MGYNLVSTRDISKTFASLGVFKDGLWDEANLIPPRLSLVAMTMKFETKLAIAAPPKLRPYGTLQICVLSSQVC